MDDQTFKVNSIKILASEHEESIKADTESEFNLESEDFNLDQIIESAVNWASQLRTSNSSFQCIHSFFRIESFTKIP